MTLMERIPSDRIRLAIEHRQTASCNLENPEHAEAVFIERRRGKVVQWNVQGDLPRIPIERIQSFMGPNPERSFPVFARCSDLVATQAKGVVGIMTIAANPSGRGFESVEALPGSKPQNAHVVLADGGDGNGFALRGRGVDAVVSKCLGDRVKLIQKVITPDPEGARTILEQRVDVDPAQTIGNPRLVLKHFELVAIVPVQPILRTKPHESPIILHDLPYHCL